MKKTLLTTFLIICMTFSGGVALAVSTESDPAFKYTDWSFNNDFTKVTVDGKTYDNYLLTTRVDGGNVQIENLGMLYLSDPWEQQRFTADEFFTVQIEKLIKSRMKGIEGVFPSRELIAINWQPWQESSFANYYISRFELMQNQRPSYDWNETLAFLTNANANGYGYDHYANNIDVSTAASVNNYQNKNAEMIGTYHDWQEFNANKGSFLNRGTKVAIYTEMKDSVANKPVTPVIIPPVAVANAIESNLNIGSMIMTKTENSIIKQITLDAPPFLSSNGYTMVPIRAISECFGVQVEWNNSKQQVVLSSNSSTIVLTAGSNQVSVDGAIVTMNESARIVNGRVFVPLRFVSETLGYKTEWYPENQRIKISK